MVIPQFSLRAILIGTAAAAIFCLVLALAINGHPLAWAFAGALGSLLLALIVYAGLFLSNWIIALVLFPASHMSRRSPFASSAPPPQLVTPPEDPE